jgi:hypothetical protein
MDATPNLPFAGKNKRNTGKEMGQTKSFSMKLTK